MTDKPMWGVWVVGLPSTMRLCRTPELAVAVKKVLAKQHPGKVIEIKETEVTANEAVPRHPAKFSRPVLDVIGKILGSEADYHRRKIRVLDPFAGTGRIHSLADEAIETVGIELEPEWAAAHPDTKVGDALNLPFPDESFDVVATSPSYGNRMADNHDAQERCRNCKATGRSEWGGICTKCGGLGRRDHRRNTYRHALGRQLSNNSSSGLQWGNRYRAFHVAAWEEALRVLRPHGLAVINSSNHIRGGIEQDVNAFHRETLVNLGASYVSTLEVATQRNRQGANSHLRVDHEVVMVFVKNANPTTSESEESYD